MKIKTYSLSKRQQFAAFSRRALGALVRKPKVKKVDLDDSHVISILREPGSLTVLLEQLRNDSRLKIAVVAEAPYREAAKYYVGENATAPHPDSAKPLDYIEYAEQRANHLELGGFKDGDSWYMWRIDSPSIQIQPGENGGNAI